MDTASLSLQRYQPRRPFDSDGISAAKGRPIWRWRSRSRRPPGLPPIDAERRALIRRMWREALSTMRQSGRIGSHVARRLQFTTVAFANADNQESSLTSNRHNRAHLPDSDKST